MAVLENEELGATVSMILAMPSSEHSFFGISNS